MGQGLSRSGDLSHAVDLKLAHAQAKLAGAGASLDELCAKARV